MQDTQYSFGMIGLGTMGHNVLLNMADHGYAVAGYDKDAAKAALIDRVTDNGSPIKGFSDIKAFVQSLKSPRSIMMLVPAGPIVDSVIAELVPLLDKGDLIIDGGNSHYTDTDRRDAALAERGLHFFGMGISGGEEGARRGPSMMPGGDKKAYLHVKPIFDAISAKVNGDPCVTYIGPGASGHFVKMVHNGIEYALMELISETYGLLKNGLQLDNAAIYDVFKQWNAGRLHSFLLEITRDIFAFKSADSDGLLVDEIKDEARSKGTGKWTSQIAMDLQVPIPAIDAAVSMRDLSKYKALRVQLAALSPDPAGTKKLSDASVDYLTQLEQAFYFSMVTTYAQGMHMLYHASLNFKYGLELDQIAKIWRGGCIIRSAFLDDIYQAYHKNNALEHLFLDPTVQASLQENVSGIRSIVSAAIQDGIAVPAYAASIGYYDALRTGRMPSNLIQAQRDYFGAHTYERIGQEGVFHTDWTV